MRPGWGPYEGWKSTSGSTVGPGVEALGEWRRCPEPRASGEEVPGEHLVSQEKVLQQQQL